MRTAVLALFLAFYVVQDVYAISGDWQTRVKLNHWSKINNIINEKLYAVERLVKSTSNNRASSCISQARSDLQEVSRAADNGIRNCVSQEKDEARASSCARIEETTATQKAEYVQRQAQECIRRA